MNGSGTLDPSGLQATVQAALGGHCSVGIDFVDIDEVARSIETLGDVYLDRLFTAHERASCIGSPRSRAASFAARFAAKEAALKVLAPTGPRPEWRSIEVVRLPHGACELHLHGTAAALADAAGLRGFSVSLTHEGGLAAAVVVGERPEEAPSITRLDVREDHNGPPENGGTEGPRHRDPSRRQGDR